MPKTLDSGHTQTYVKGKGYEYTHRIIMQKKLGRKLREDEEVHHKNGKFGDNRPENLEVMTTGDHNKVTDRNGGRKKGSKNGVRNEPKARPNRRN
jgi:hypothetical protein